MNWYNICYAVSYISSQACVGVIIHGGGGGLHGTETVTNWRRGDELFFWININFFPCNFVRSVCCCWSFVSVCCECFAPAHDFKSWHTFVYLLTLHGLLYWTLDNCHLTREQLPDLTITFLYSSDEVWIFIIIQLLNHLVHFRAWLSHNLSNCLLGYLQSLVLNEWSKMTGSETAFNWSLFKPYTRFHTPLLLLGYEVMITLEHYPQISCKGFKAGEIINNSSQWLARNVWLKRNNIAQKWIISKFDIKNKLYINEKMLLIHRGRVEPLLRHLWLYQRPLGIILIWHKFNTERYCICDFGPHTIHWSRC